jgi:hypothetical protein
MSKEKSYSKGSSIPRLELIPREALIRLAGRFELGVKNYQDKAWNALSPNQECLSDRDMAIARAAHALDHASKLIAILSGQMPDDGDDHAGAILWAGSFLAMASDVLRGAE